MEPANLSARLNGLERANRRLKMVVVACLILTGLVVATNWLTPTKTLEAGEEKQKDDVNCKRVICKQLEVQDDEGQTVVVINGNAPKGGNPGIQMMRDDTALETFNRKGTKTFSMNVINGDIMWKGDRTGK